MDRLTTKDKKGINVIISDVWGYTTSGTKLTLYGNVAERLSAYEDTGLNPEEIPALKAFKEYFDDLYGKGLKVANYHLNGETESFDSFYESALSCYDEEKKSVTSQSPIQDHVQCKDCEYFCNIGGNLICGYPRMISHGLDDWCRHGKKRGANHDA